MSSDAQNSEHSWLNRHLFLSKLALVLLSSLLTLFVAEFTLRILGKKTGYIPRYSRFRPVEQLEVYDSFFTDSEGVFKANPNYAWSEGIHINSDGFRSAEFNPGQKTTQRKILFLGDSFTWGSSAKPLTQCFVDIVSRRGFLTFNTGIPGTDPNQYAYLAEKYVPLLKPDIVAVMFYLANDFKPPRPMLPNKNLFHLTNAKMLYAFDENGNHMSPQEAYDYYLAKSNAAHARNDSKTMKDRIRKIFMSSVIGTYFWVAVSRMKPQFMTDSTANDDSKDIKYEHTRQLLARIKAVSEKYGARFMLFLIAVHPQKQHIYNSVEYNLGFLKEFDPYIPDFLDVDDYMALPNAHFNNSGHRKYAEFILKMIGESNNLEKTTNE